MGPENTIRARQRRAISRRGRRRPTLRVEGFIERAGQELSLELSDRTYDISLRASYTMVRTVCRAAGRARIMGRRLRRSRSLGIFLWRSHPDARLSTRRKGCGRVVAVPVIASPRVVSLPLAVGRRWREAARIGEARTHRHGVPRAIQLLHDKMDPLGQTRTPSV